MLLFRSEETVDAWCRAHSVARRPLVSLPQLWGLAKAWYASRLSETPRRPAALEMVEIFAGLGLHGPFWDPRGDAWSEPG